MRPKISVYIAASLDGFIARKNGSVDWLDRMGGFEEDYGFANFLDSVDSVVMGRKTYGTPGVTSAWPYKGKRVVVLSRTLKEAEHGAEIFAGDVRILLAKLQSEGIEHIWVDGGDTIAQFLDILDEIIISIIPVLLGSGIPLFPKEREELALKLIESKAYPSGLVQVRYTPLR